MKLKKYLSIILPVQRDAVTERNTAGVWNDFRNGNELAFTTLYKQYVCDLYQYGERFTSNKQLIEDSIHDFFVDLWNHRAGYGEVSDLKFYLLKGFKYRLIKNLERLRKLPVDYDISEDYSVEIVFSKEFEWIAIQVSEETKASIVQGLNALSKREKEAIIFKFYDGLSYEQIADLMSLSVKSTYKLIYRAIDALRKSLKKAGLR